MSHDTSAPGREYWDAIAEVYQEETHISCDDFHYGPLLPGDAEIGLLPASVKGLNCLELGCGAAQNSIFLARRGAQCTAIDLSAAQLQSARSIAAEERVDVALIQADIGVLPLVRQPQFDLIHSTYALPFVGDQRKVVLQAAARLRPGGWLLLSTAHPLSTSEWLDVDEDESGVFLQDYFNPAADSRIADRDHGESRSQPVPTSQVFAWLREAGLTVEQFLEPQPLPLSEMTDGSIPQRIPYWSSAWLERYDELARVPFVAIFLARKGAHSR